MRFLRVCPFFFVFFIVLGFTIARPLFAFSLSPAINDISLQPGGIYSGIISVMNDTDAEETYYLSIQKFLPKGDAGQEEFLPIWETSGLPKWIYLNAPSVTLKAGESRSVPFTIRVPANAVPGGYYAALFFSNRPPIMGPQGRVVTGARTGSLILLTVEGRLVKKLALQSFALETATQLRSLPAGFETVLENQGNIHVIPDGKITIKNYFGYTAAVLPLNPDGARVLPNSTRRFSSVWQSAVPLNGNGFWHHAAEELRNFAIGRYTATLQLQGPGSENVQPTSLVFYVWPWELLMCLAGFFVLLIVCIRLYRHWVIYRATLS
ncbi:MAG TPA: hypothetical protein VFQ60_04190 [Patescibacteria group bacterium]|nr:hypothetical protein [Patescibacteria group bacterium]